MTLLMQQGLQLGAGGLLQEFLFDPADKHANVTLSEEGALATATAGSGYWYAMGTNPKNSGQWQFEFEIASMPTDGGFISIGLADKPPTGSTTSTTYAQVGTGFSWLGRKVTPFSRFYYGGGTSSYDNLAPADERNFDTGDLITSAVDFDTEVVTVYRNGEPIYTKTVLSINPAYLYVPTIKLWGQATPAAVRIPKKISFPVPGHAPWV